MKLVIILQIVVCLQVSAAGYSQKVSLSVKNASLEEVFEALQQQCGYMFIFNAQTMQKAKKVSIDVKDATVEEVLELCFKNQVLTYEVIDKTIIVKPKPAPPQITLDEEPPPLPVRGIIKDEEGNPIPNVSVMVKGKRTGTQTNAQGEFSIETDDNAILVFSSVGFETVEMRVSKDAVMQVVLTAASQALTDVVVTAIGIKANKTKLGYSVQNVDSRDIVESRETNLVSALSGKAAGVNITSSSGSPGASANITIRGNKSITGSNKPLFVIDGLPVDNSSYSNTTGGVDNSNRAIDINPNDIKSLTILKGPAATALYGIRAANGAIIITTKSGSTGKPRFTFTSAFSVNQVSQLPERQFEYAQGTISGGQFVYRAPDAASVTTNSWGPALSELEYDGDAGYPYDKNGRLVQKGTGNGMAAKAYDPYDAFFVDGHTYDNNLSVSGGSEKVTYYFSAGRLYQTGVVPRADFARNSFKSNVNFTLNKNFSIGSSVSYINSGGNRIQRGSNVSGVMAALLRNTPSFDIGNGKKGNDAADDPATYSFANGGQRAFSRSYDNPFWSVNNVPYKDEVNRVIGNMHMELKLTDWIKIRYKAGIDYFSDIRNMAWDINSSSNRTGRIIRITGNSTDINSDLLLLITKNLTNEIQLDATFGHNYFQSNYTIQEIQGDELGQKAFFDISNAAAISTDYDVNRRKLVGVFGDMKFSYKDYLFLNLTGRNDWSSTLPKSNNSLFYPTISVGVELANAFGFSNNPVLPYAKIRASYGQVGNDAPLYALNTYYATTQASGDDLNNPGIVFPAFGVSSFERSGTLANNNLKPERTSTFEIGGDFKFLDGRIGLDATYYHASTDDQIVTTTIPASSGFLQQVINAGKIQNKGVEIVLSGTPVRSPFFTWEVGINFTKNESLVKELPLGVSQVSLLSFSALTSLVKTGEPYGVLNGTHYQRNASGQLIIGSNGWPLIATTQDPIGDPNPDFTAGVNNAFTYKNFRLSMLWDFRQGGDIWNATRAFNSFLGVTKETGDLRTVTGYIFDGVKANGDKNDTPVDFANPANGLGGIKWRRGGNFGVSEDYIEDGSWARLRQVTLTWSIPNKLFKNIITGSSVSVYARNLLLFTGYSGIDPETNLTGDSNATGWDYYNLPGTKSYGINLQVNF